MNLVMIPNQVFVASAEKLKRILCVMDFSDFCILNSFTVCCVYLVFLVFVCTHWNHRMAEIPLMSVVVL